MQIQILVDLIWTVFLEQVPLYGWCVSLEKKRQYVSWGSMKNHNSYDMVLGYYGQPATSTFATDCNNVNTPDPAL